MESKENLIELRNINLTYNRGDDNAFQSLFDINVNIKPGEFVIILGPSGCGKSSLLNIVSGLENPDSGTVLIDGVDVLGMKSAEKIQFYRNKIGMIFQAYNLIPTLSVMDNVALPQIFINTKRKEREEKIMLLLEKLEIKDQWKKIPSELSGGQQQRIGIARAIINDPELILADEPVGNLDSQSANNVMQIISELNRSEGKTVLLVTHDQENIVWGTHIIHMKDGRIVKEEWKNQTGFSKEVKSDLEKNKSEIDRIIEKFRGITKRKTNFILDPLKANAITKSMLIPYEEKQLKIIEESVRLTLTGVYDIKKFFETMDKAVEDGGAGLDERIAKKFSLELNNLIGISKRVFGDSSNREKSLAIIEHLIKNRDIQIKGEKIEKVAVLIEKRIEEKISYVDLQKNLDLPENLGGVGLDRRTVMKILREIELILIAGIGLN